MQIAGKFIGEENKHSRYLCYFILTYAAIMIAYNMARLWGFGFFMEDLGLYRQVVSNTSNGNWFQTSIKYPYNPDNHWLGIHFSVLPILAALPFYKLFPFAETLEVIHVGLVSSTTFIIYQTCRKLGLKDSTSFIWSLAYLLHPITTYHLMFSFQETSFSVFLQALAIYFVVAKNFRNLLITCALLIITKEHHGINIFGLGVLWMLYHKNFRQGALLSVIGVIAVALIMFVIIPQFNAFKEHFMFTADNNTSGFGRYQWLSLPFDQLIMEAPGIIFSPQNVSLTFFCFLTFAFLPFGGLIFLLPVIADYMVVTLSQDPVTKFLNFYYQAPFVPVLVIASAYSLKKLTQKKPKLAKYWGYAAVICVLGGNIMPLSTLSQKLGYIPKGLFDWAISEQYQEAASIIPKDKFVITDQQAGLYITDRRFIASYSYKDEQLKKADYIFIRLNPFDMSPSPISQYESGIMLARSATGSKDFGLVFWKYPYAVFKRGSERKVTQEQWKEFATTYNNALNYYLTNMPKMHKN